MVDTTFLESLQCGDIRVASPSDGEWHIHTDVKQKILDLFRQSSAIAMPGGFRDKEPLRPRVFDENEGVRMVPGGTAVRPGAYIAKNVVIMPPSYVNIGAYVDEGTMIDSHVLVGSCAQIGKRVHLSAAVQIGGVLEPIGNKPVIIEDDCFIGAGSILVEGIWVRERAVIAPGVILSASVPVYDVVHQTILKGEIPENAVVVPGTRRIGSHYTSRSWIEEQGLSVGCAVIIKYRNQETDTSIVLENALRDISA